MKKVGFFFGAGVEGKNQFEMPTGPLFTEKTICTKKTSLYEALSEFYKDRTPQNYTNQYSSEYLFSSNSHTFREIIKITAQYIKENVKTINNEKIEKVCEIPTTKDDEYEKLIQILFNNIILNENGIADCKDEFVEEIRQNLLYYGSIEKDFSTIVAPKDAGNKRFWRLVNYFWSAFFTILTPMIDNIDPEIVNGTNIKSIILKYNDSIDLKGKYSVLLDNINEIIIYINSSDFYEKQYELDKSYYHILSKIDKQFDIYCALTSNYTPFIQCMGLQSDKYAFLAGKLNWFEMPHKISCKEISPKCKIESNDFVFPYLFTQAAVKPMVETLQMKEYAKAINFLDEIDVLVILGYGLNSNDNHINALIRNFAINREKTLIYCNYYSKENFEMELEERISETIKYVCSSLKLEVGLANIIPIIHNGDVEDVVDMIFSAVKNV